LRYVWRRPDLKAVLFMLFVFGTFGLNFPIFIATMAVQVFHKGAGQYGLLTSVMAVGSVAGALLSARRPRPRFGVLVSSASLFGVFLAGAAVAPRFLLLAAALLAVGITAQTFTTTANSAMQLASEPSMRGRVMAIFLAVTFGGTLVGAPAVGWVADTWGPRWALAVGAAAGFVAAIIGFWAPRKRSRGPVGGASVHE
jgi:MFS family permease